MSNTEAIRMAGEAKKMAHTAGVTANAALLNCNTALVKIEAHEELCAERWSSIQHLQRGIFMMVTGVAGFLLVDKFFA